jgi:hypothetical protein
VKEKFSDKSNHTPKTKKSIPCEFKAYDPSLSLDDRTALWKENGKNLFGNIKILAPDFKKSQDVIADLILNGSEDFAADEFNAADYAGFDAFCGCAAHLLEQRERSDPFFRKSCKSAGRDGIGPS